MAKQEEKYGRKFGLAQRQIEFTHLSTTPEKKGPDGAKKAADLQVVIELKGAEIKRLDPGLPRLWAEHGPPAIENLGAPIKLGTAFRGTASIGSNRGKPVDYEGALLTDFRTLPLEGGVLQAKARIRVYLEHETDDLYDLRIAGLCLMAFDGKLIKSAVSNDTDETQAELPV